MSSWVTRTHNIAPGNYYGGMGALDGNGFVEECCDVAYELKFI